MQTVPAQTLAGQVQAETANTDFWGFALDGAALIRELHQASLEAGQPPLSEEAARLLPGVRHLAFAGDCVSGDRIAVRMVARLDAPVPEPARKEAERGVLTLVRRMIDPDLNLDAAFQWPEPDRLALHLQVDGVLAVLREAARTLDLEASMDPPPTE